MLVFLNGTCGQNLWRPALVKRLYSRGISKDVEFFDPMTQKWNARAQEREEAVRRASNLEFHYIGNPMPGQATNTPSIISPVEAVISLKDIPDYVCVVVDWSDLTGHARATMKRYYEMITGRFPRAAIFKEMRSGEDWLFNRLPMAHR